MASEHNSVAIIVAARNAQATVADAVASALAQAPVQEVHVVDDASTDATTAAARGADDGSNRLRLHRFEANRGPSAARNHAISQSGCDYVCVLDADDVLLPGRIDRMLAFMDGADMVADDLLIVPQGAPASDAGALCAAPARDLGMLDLAGFLEGNLSRPGQSRRELGYLKPLMKRSFLLEHGLQYREDMRLGEDYALYASALAKGARLRLVSACGYVAVVHPTSLSHVHSADDLAAVLAFDDALLLGAPLDAPSRAALQQHRREAFRRLSHRRALDARRKRAWSDVLRWMTGSADVFGYIVHQTVRDKLIRQPATNPVAPHLLFGETAEASSSRR